MTKLLNGNDTNVYLSELVSRKRLLKSPGHQLQNALPTRRCPLSSYLSFSLLRALLCLFSSLSLTFNSFNRSPAEAAKPEGVAAVQHVTRTREGSQGADIAPDETRRRLDQTDRDAFLGP